MTYRPGGRLEHDSDGRLYEPDLRALVGRSLEPDRVVAVEALLSLQHAAFVLQKFMGALRNVADRLSAITYGVETDALAALRHVCLTLARSGRELPNR